MKAKEEMPRNKDEGLNSSVSPAASRSTISTYVSMCEPAQQSDRARACVNESACALPLTPVIHSVPSHSIRPVRCTNTVQHAKVQMTREKIELQFKFLLFFRGTCRLLTAIDRLVFGTSILSLA